MVLAQDLEVEEDAAEPRSAELWKTKMLPHSIGPHNKIASAIYIYTLTRKQLRVNGFSCLPKRKPKP